MNVPLVSAIVAHKFAAALIIASLAISGGAVAEVSGGMHQSNTVGEMSFSINPAFNVTSLASLNLGTLTGGQTGTMSSMATVNFTSTGNYTIGLVNFGLLHSVFGTFNVTITGLGNQVDLTLTHISQTVNVTSKGVDTLRISVVYVVSSSISTDHGITVTNAPFLELFHGAPHPGQHQIGNPHSPPPPQAHHDND
ncbi:MAG: hypothetical protein JRN67_07220 [Nitrososphaerota archaeon]|nr:hypothetical protein [Nitrososphaerota archaeon]